MRFNTKGIYIVGKVKKGKASTFLLLGDGSFQGSVGVFIDNTSAHGISELDRVEVELVLNIKPERLKRNEEIGFFEVLRDKRVISIRKV